MWVTNSKEPFGLQGFNFQRVHSKEPSPRRPQSFSPPDDGDQGCQVSDCSVFRPYSQRQNLYECFYLPNENLAFQISLTIMRKKIPLSLFFRR